MELSWCPVTPETGQQGQAEHVRLRISLSFSRCRSWLPSEALSCCSSLPSSSLLSLLGCILFFYPILKCEYSPESPSSSFTPLVYSVISIYFINLTPTYMAMILGFTSGSALSWSSTRLIDNQLCPVPPLPFPWRNKHDQAI